MSEQLQSESSDETALAVQSQDASREMQNRWYNYLVNETQLTPEKFQLIQGRSRPLENDASFWGILDTLPPKSVSHNFQDAGASLFQSYVDLLGDLKKKYDDVVKKILSDSEYESWLTYRKNHAGAYLDHPARTFEQWGLQNRISRSKIQRGKRALERGGAGGPVAKAMKKVTEYKQGGNPTNPPKYNHTFDDLEQTLSDASSLDISFDSSKHKADVKHTWAQGEASTKLLGFITVDGKVTYDKVSKTAFSSHMEVSGSFDHFTTYSADPGSWFDDQVLADAYNHRDGSGDIWKSGADPSDYFGENGTLQYVPNELVLAQDFEIHVELHTEFTEVEKKVFEAEGDVHLNVWPLLGITVKGGYKTESKHVQSSEQNPQFTLKSEDDTVQLLGVNVLPIEQYV